MMIRCGGRKSKRRLKVRVEISMRTSWRPGMGEGNRSMGEDPSEIPTRGKYRDCSGHLLEPGRTFSGGKRAPNHPQNLQPKICPAYKICRDKDGAEIEGTANQCLAQLETYPM